MIVHSRFLLVDICGLFYYIRTDDVIRLRDILRLIKLFYYVQQIDFFFCASELLARPHMACTEQKITALDRLPLAPYFFVLCTLLCHLSSINTVQMHAKMKSVC